MSEFQGLLQSDGYAVCDKACDGLAITQLGCWAHPGAGVFRFAVVAFAPRYYDAWKGGESGAVRYFLHIRNLYEIEGELPEDTPL